jgi:cellulose synthase operon protein C
MSPCSPWLKGFTTESTERLCDLTVEGFTTTKYTLKKLLRNCRQVLAVLTILRGKSSRRLLVSALTLLVLSQLVFHQATRASLAKWAQELEAGSKGELALFRSMPLPGGAIPFLRPPAEAQTALAKLISASPDSASLVSLRARVEEERLDFRQAEADWTRYAQLVKDRGAGQLALADFYHRRLRPRDEIQALEACARGQNPADQRLLPPGQQRSWQAFERIFAVIQAQALPASVSSREYRTWIARYPRQGVLYKRFFNFLVAQKSFTEAETVLATYKKAFPNDAVFLVEAEAATEYHRGSAKQALALYDHAFQPLWPDELVRAYFNLLTGTHQLRRAYFNLLTGTHQLREFLSQAREAAAANPDDLNAAARLFYYFKLEGNSVAAARPLIEYRMQKEAHKVPWTTQQLYTLARLFESLNNYNEAARYYYALYSLPGSQSDSGDAARALASLANILFEAAGQPVAFASGDLSFYHDVATMDPYPGFLNGILSLILNSTHPGQNYASEDQASSAYFQRAEAAKLVALFDRRFPASAKRPQLHFQLIQSYASYGASDAVIRAGKEFSVDFPNSRLSTSVALLMADAYARTGRTQDELATYDNLLKHLAAQAHSVPLGPAVVDTPGSARSADYQQVLDIYISRLLAIHQPLKVLALYRREIDRNPDDFGLYSRFAEFLESNHLDGEVEQTYKLAIERFKTRGWYDRLARWYLRHKRQEDFDRLTREVVMTFKGSALDNYFEQVTDLASITPQLYLQLNLYAHQRFLHRLTFVRNLLSAYESGPTRNAAAWERLMRRNWFYASDLRDRFFEHLSSTGKLNAELAALGAPPAAPLSDIIDALRNKPEPTASPSSGPGPLAQSDPAAAQFIADGEAWQSHFENAAPFLRALEEEYPSQADLGDRAAAVYRSLATYQSADTAAAAEIEMNLHRATPRSSDVLARIGDIYADREAYAQARPYWDQIPHIDPGEPGGYLDAATICWDYFLFKDALRIITEGRQKLGRPDFGAYEAGAIYEGMGDDQRAIAEYTKGALAATPDQSFSARDRLLTLAKRPSLESLVDRVTAQTASGANPGANAVSLRVAVLKAQNRQADLKSFLGSLANETSSLDLLARLGEIAGDEGLESVGETALLRQIAVIRDPVERMQLRLRLARFDEGQGHVGTARQVMDQLYSRHPRILGIVRATVDFYWRNKMPGQAVDILARSAQQAYPALRNSFLLEAAHKANESGDYARARTLVTPLLRQNPFDADVLAVVAESYARVGDDEALRQFYLARIQVFRSASLPPTERASRIASLRRGLIPALTRLKKYGAALNQYVAIINSYPEDQGLSDEAASYELLIPPLQEFRHEEAAETRCYRNQQCESRSPSHPVT